jgi:hypothetical protein
MDAATARMQIILAALDEATVSARVERLAEEIRVVRLIDAMRPFLLSAKPPPRPAPPPVFIPGQRRPLPPEVIRAAHASQAKFGRNQPGRPR